MDYPKVLSDTVSLAVIILWLVIPLWWIPVHGAINLIRKVGVFIYPMVFVVWAACAYLIYVNKGFLLGFHIDFSMPIRAVGTLLSVAGIFLQLWTLKELSTRVITGVPELIEGEKVKLAVKGPFSKVRHPTYMSHTLLFMGIFLVTGTIATGFVVLVDFLVVTLIIIPLEEKELLRRFGDQYRTYMVQTPRLFPRIRKNK